MCRATRVSGPFAVLNGISDRLNTEDRVFYQGGVALLSWDKQKRLSDFLRQSEAELGSSILQTSVLTRFWVPIGI